MANAQEWLDKNYPLEERNEIKELNINGKNLEGHLDLRDFVNLESLNLNFNKINSLDISSCSKLVTLLCGVNPNLENVDLSKNKKLKHINFGGNYNFRVSLETFSHLTELEELGINETPCYGSLKSLEGLNKLKVLWFESNNIDSNLEHLPESLESIRFRHRNLVPREIREKLQDYEMSGLLYGNTYTYDYQAWRKDNYELVKLIKVKPILQKQIGVGGFAIVYQGVWKGNPVAIKKSIIRSNQMTEKELKDFEEEVKKLKNLRNSYIILYIDMYQDKQDLMVITELAQHGSLTNYINNHKDQEYNLGDWKTNYNFIKQMSLGLSYLHHSNIIHCDLKSMNILICEGLIAKIADFGISKVVDNLTISKTASKGVAGTVRWMAPELLTKHKKHTTYSDIYALGMIIWEITAQKTVPFAYAENNVDVLMCHLRGEKEEIPTETPEPLKEIIQACWKENPSERISLAQITNKVETVLQGENKTEKITPITQDQSEQNNSDQTVVEQETELITLIEQPPK